MNPIIEASWIAAAGGAFGAVAGITGGVIVARIGLHSNRGRLRVWRLSCTCSWRVPG